MVLILGLAFHDIPLLAADAFASASAVAIPFTITSITADGTNLVFSATIPSGLAQVTLETRPALDGTWTDAKHLDVQTSGGEVAFTLPKPETPTAFFRLKAEQALQNVPLVSGELLYVTMPSLASAVADNGDAIFHFKGLVDGSDKILITREGALWSHVNWSWPQRAVTINSNRWNPKEKNYLTTLGETIFLPEQFSLQDAQLEVIHGRDVVALERGPNALAVILNDTPNGADTYEFKIHFHPTATKPAQATTSTVATLKIAGVIDGSDYIKLTTKEASWEHKSRAYPSQVTLNGVPWNPKIEPVRKNEGTNQFLPSGIDLSTAKIVGRNGRDLATMWSDTSAVYIRFADNPNGTDAYELEISFGP